MRKEMRSVYLHTIWNASHINVMNASCAAEFLDATGLPKPRQNTRISEGIQSKDSKHC